MKGNWRIIYLVICSVEEIYSICNTHTEREREREKKRERKREREREREGGREGGREREHRHIPFPPSVFVELFLPGVVCWPSFLPFFLPQAAAILWGVHAVCEPFHPLPHTAAEELICERR